MKTNNYPEIRRWAHMLDEAMHEDNSYDPHDHMDEFQYDNNKALVWDSDRYWQTGSGNYADTFIDISWLSKSGISFDATKAEVAYIFVDQQIIDIGVNSNARWVCMEFDTAKDLCASKQSIKKSNKQTLTNDIAFTKCARGKCKIEKQIPISVFGNNKNWLEFSKHPGWSGINLFKLWNGKIDAESVLASVGDLVTTKGEKLPTWEFIYADSAYDLKEYLTVTGIENDYFNESEKSNMLDEFDDVRLPRGRVGHHETGIPVRYWVAVEDYSEKLTNHGWYLNQSLQRNPVGHNNSPSFTTTDLNKAKELAKRAVTKCQGKLYVMIGKDDHSRGMVTQKNHLRGGAIVDCWLPKMHMWRDGIVE